MFNDFKEFQCVNEMVMIASVGLPNSDELFANDALLGVRFPAALASVPVGSPQGPSQCVFPAQTYGHRYKESHKISN